VPTALLHTSRQRILDERSGPLTHFAIAKEFRRQGCASAPGRGPLLGMPTWRECASRPTRPSAADRAPRRPRFTWWIRVTRSFWYPRGY